jgi:hypothetical protein
VILDFHWEGSWHTPFGDFAFRQVPDYEAIGAITAGQFGDPALAGLPRLTTPPTEFYRSEYSWSGGGQMVVWTVGSDGTQLQGRYIDPDAGSGTFQLQMQPGSPPTFAGTYAADAGDTSTYYWSGTYVGTPIAELARPFHEKPLLALAPVQPIFPFTGGLGCRQTAPMSAGCWTLHRSHSCPAVRLSRSTT